MLRSALGVAPSPRSFAPLLIIIIVAEVAIVAMLILPRVMMRKSRHDGVRDGCCGTVPLDVLPHPPCRALQPSIRSRGRASPHISSAASALSLLLLMVPSDCPTRGDRPPPDQ
jgi:hypothetical protein